MLKLRSKSLGSAPAFSLAGLAFVALSCAGSHSTPGTSGGTGGDDTPTDTGGAPGKPPSQDAAEPGATGGAGDTGGSGEGGSATGGSGNGGEGSVDAGSGGTGQSDASGADKGPEATGGTSGGGPGMVLWEADTTLGTAAFEGIEEKPGKISVVDDPLGTYGKVFTMQVSQLAGYYKDRCETRGCRKKDGSTFRMTNGETYYIGWRSMWNPLPSTTWLAVFQIHGYGDVGCHAPLVLRTLSDGKLYMQHQQPDGASVDLWTAPLVLNKWHTFAVHFKLTDKPADAFLEFWYDGTQQMLKGGVMRYPAALWNCAWVNVKWGIYRHSTPGPGEAYMSRARIGTSFEAVDPTKP
jgi:hypothetical protein